MNDLELAKSNLPGHTICLCKDKNLVFSEKRGISPMMGFIADGIDLKGYSVADLIVGKAVAMLFVKCGIIRVFAKTLSVSGKKILERHGIDYEYETLTDKIINRDGTDVCPMEKTVANTEDIEEGYKLLKDRLQTIKKDGN